MARSSLALVVALSLVAAATVPAHAQVYRWVDAQGRVHYGDVAAAPRQARVTTVNTPAPASDRAYLGEPALPVTDAATPPDTSSDPQVDDGSAQACQIARRNRELLADPGRDVLDDTGQQVMSPAARAQRLARVDLEIEAFCNVLGAGSGGGS